MPPYAYLLTTRPLLQSKCCQIMYAVAALSASEKKPAKNKLVNYPCWIADNTWTESAQHSTQYFVLEFSLT
jgi:hypothetical protein